MLLRKRKLDIKSMNNLCWGKNFNIQRYNASEYLGVSWSGALVRLLLQCIGETVAKSTTMQYGYSTVLHRWQHVFTSRKEKVV